MSHPLSGVLPVFQTPYHENDTIDAETLEKEIDWLFDCGSNGIVLAMVSEILRLTPSEFEQLTNWSCQFAKNRGAVIISVGAESTKLAVERARIAEQAGATAVMAVPPVSIGALEDELLSYYESLVKAISLPVIVQDASGYVGKPMSIEVQAQMLKEHGPEKILFKPEATPIGPRLSALRDATNGTAGIFEGTGGIALVDSYRRGIVGTMPGADLIRGIVPLYEALKQGDEKRIYQLSLPISAIVAAQSSLDAFLAIEKHLLVKQGIFRNTIVRGPVAYKPDQETLNEVDRLFEQLQQALNQTS